MRDLNNMVKEFILEKDKTGKVFYATPVYQDDDKIAIAGDIDSLASQLRERIGTDDWELTVEHRKITELRPFNRDEHMKLVQLISDAT